MEQLCIRREYTTNKYFKRQDIETVNVEIFAGLNFGALHGFHQYYKCFSVNICLYTQALYNGIVQVF